MPKKPVNTPYQILLFYIYDTLENPTELMKWQRTLCERLGLKGRVLISAEGMNATLEGETEKTEEYVKEMCKRPQFANIDFKRSEGTGTAFPKLQVKVKEEIVTTRFPGKDEVGPHKGVTGKYLSAEQLHDWIHNSDKEFYIVDMRNDYEYESGHFAGSVLLKDFKTFRDLPNLMDQIDHLRHKTVVTVCTGGVRCEKASGFLIKHGFTDVYQLHNGIVTYMEAYPNEDFLGKLYVFDERVVMGFNIDSADHVVIGKCRKCGKTSENYIDYVEDGHRKHGIVCEECITKGLAIPD